MRRLLAAALTAVALAFAGPAPATAVPVAPQAAATCSGVWVVVESTVRCATSHDTGTTALRSAGFSIESTGGLICRINGSPATCEASYSGYWSYWHAKRQADGTYGAWQYSTKGAGQYRPAQGDAEGWAYGDGKRPPAGRIPVSAPVAPAPAPPPAPAPTTAPPRTTTAPKPTSGATTRAPGGAAAAGAAGSAAPAADPSPAGVEASSPTPIADSPAASATAAPTTPEASPAEPTASTPGQAQAGVSGPAALAFTAGLVALGAVGIAFAKRRRAP